MQSPNDFDLQLRKEALEEKRVIVRVWTSLANQLHPGESVGHVSVEIPHEGVYWSLWPKDGNQNEPSAKDSEGLGIIKPISAEPLEGFTYEKDFFFEGNRAPALVYCLYTLEVGKMLTRFVDLSQSGIGWNFVGRLFFMNAGSCASSAWELLQAGGIHRLVSTSAQSSIVSSRAAAGAYQTGVSMGGGLLGSLQGFFGKSQQGSAQPDFSESSQASSYTSEMMLGAFINSPDLVGELLKYAKQKELEKEPLTKDLIFEGETPIASLGHACSVK